MLEPVIDAAFAGAAFYITAACFDENKHSNAPACIGPVVLDLAAVPSLFSAVYGAVQLAGCHEARRIQRESIQARREKTREVEEARRREKAELMSRESVRAKAWSDAQRAEGLARTGDCAAAIELANAVRDADEDLYSTVLTRDAAFARCLTP